MSFELNILILCLETDGFSLITKWLLWKETALAVANASFYLAQSDGLSRNFKRLSLGFCVLFPSQGQSKYLLLARLTPKHFANVSTRSAALCGTSWELSFGYWPSVHANFYLWSLSRHLSPPILKGGWPRPGIELENPCLGLVSRSALAA